MQSLPAGTNWLPGNSGWKGKVRERGGGVKAAVDVRCINAVYCKSHVGEPRLLGAQASCPMSAWGDKDGLKIVTVASK